ncbi:MAG: Oligopeptide-binding protein OppA [Phycisphaerae bacterium]|nr:Oligopeptide-binding protein OppA [Phycisphaerae bacterium]
MKLWIGIGVLAALFAAAFIIIPMLSSSGDDAGEMVRHIALGSKIRGLDPQDIGDTTSSSVGSQIFETLYTYAYLKRPYEVIPLLADDMPTISDDQMTWTIPIRKGIRFADDPAFREGRGRELLAQDFVYSWKRMADLNNRSTNYSAVFAGYVVGLDEFRDYTANNNHVDYDREVEGLKALDSHTLQIKLTKPHNFLLYWLAHLPTAAVAREVVERYDSEIANHPVGTGPYILVGGYAGKSSFSMIRNPNFRGEHYPTEGEPGDKEAGFLDDAGKRIPFIDRVEWSIIEEDQPYWLNFLKGNIDSAGIPKDNFSQAITVDRELSPDLARKGISLNKFKDPSVYYYGFNMDDPVIGTNKPLRQAMSLAFNRQVYIDTFLNGRGELPKGPIPSMFPGYRTDKVNPYVAFDLDLAKAKLAEAEKIQGGPIPPMRLALGGTDTTVTQMGKFFRIQMKQIGLDVEVDYMTWPRFQEAQKTRSHQLFGLGWVADYPDAESFLLLFYSKNRSPGPNGTNYSNPEFDRLYEQAKGLPSLNDRIPLYQKMEDIVIEDCPWLITHYRLAFILHYDWLKNYKPNDFANGTLKYQRVDMALRKRRLKESE